MVRTIVRIVMALCAFAAGSAGAAHAFDGEWSRHAVSVSSKRMLAIPSPDRSRTIYIREMELVVMEQGRPAAGAEAIGMLFPAEIGWSPDSKAFFITSSDGGPGGAWDVEVFLQEYERFAYYGVTAAAAESFRTRHPCADRDQPDMGAIRWIKDSKQLLLVAEVPRKATCAGRGAVRGFLVEVPSGRVLREFDRQMLIEEFGEVLGERFSKPLPR